MWLKEKTLQDLANIELTEFPCYIMIRNKWYRSYARKINLFDWNFESDVAGNIEYIKY